MIDRCIDQARKLAEACDALQGIFLQHSISNGCGAGLGTLFNSKMVEEYSDKIHCSFLMAPSKNLAQTVMEPYNSILSYHQLCENSGMTFMFDNETLYNKCIKD